MRQISTLKKSSKQSSLAFTALLILNNLAPIGTAEAQMPSLQTQPIQTIQTPPAPIISDAARTLPVLGKSFMVSSQEAKASQIGADILKRGGNAIDAGVAIGFALAVTLPRAGNLGGGGFMLIHRAAKSGENKAGDNKSGETIAIDYREVAPLASTATMFLDEKGEPDTKKSRDSALSIGVPGTVKGLALAHKLYGSGKFTLAELIEPARLLAAEGIIIADDLADSLPKAAARLGRFASTRAIFFDGEKTKPAGTRLVQSDLAATLRTLQTHGEAGFYEGSIAEKLIKAVQSAGGIMQMEDLRRYTPVLRKPLEGSYRGHNIITMPPPSSGGIHLLQILNLLEAYDLGALKPQSAATSHLYAEAMKPAYADRATFLGDPERVKLPIRGLTSKKYADEQRKTLDLSRARPASEVKAGNPLPYESDQTTHYSVVDGAGNAVSNTYTLNFSYGMGMVAEGTGIILNNEMDDFSAKAGAQNAYGLVGSDANAVAPQARPLSSMTPTFVFKDGALQMVTGSPGGSRIITTVLQVISNVIDHKMNLAEAVAAPRLHHQWQPDVLLMESGFSTDTIALLKARGYQVREGATSGSANSIMRVEGSQNSANQEMPPAEYRWAGASDPRQRGTLAVGD